MTVVKSEWGGNTIHTFTGVIFSLKVLSSTYTPEDVFLMGWLPVPSKYACWAELILIQVLSPNASFIGHLAGIVAGLMYTMGPLRWIVDFATNIIEGVVANNRRGPVYADEDQWGYGRPSAPRFEGSGGTWGQGRRSTDGYDRYTGGLTEEEQMRRATEESLRQRRHTNQYGWSVD